MASKKVVEFSWPGGAHVNKGWENKMGGGGLVGRRKRRGRRGFPPWDSEEEMLKQDKTLFSPL